MSRDSEITRNEDMSPDGRLTLLKCDDGDIILTVREAGEKGSGQSVEFCNSGGQSRRTLAALHALHRAMLEDEAERPHGYGAEARRVPDGTDGVRDLDNPCLHFKSGAPTNGNCHGDGHYLCLECIHLVEWRRKEMKE